MAAPVTQVLAQQQAENSTISAADTGWRDAAHRWSLRVASRAQQIYQLEVVRLGFEGRVEAMFRIGVDGTVRDCAVHRSSGAAELDALVCRAIAQSPPAPVNLDAGGQAQEVAVVLPVEFVMVDDLPPAEKGSETN
ncbi:energy transducer TonB [Qipengyuania gaetbuli]|uniref:TonB family protein n=1 Tax=Qipengyuania gaetbuli TaxID=266952 RepID=UPI001C993BB8|nr:TonB family protein [Qipengyuania gaetbuli]MBY6014774.1 energy transducer TonB [Qipengyuania gaetbuli]